jgi:hypothetical protein
MTNRSSAFRYDARREFADRPVKDEGTSQIDLFLVVNSVVLSNLLQLDGWRRTERAMSNS